MVSTACELGVEAFDGFSARAGASDAVRKADCSRSTAVSVFSNEASGLPAGIVRGGALARRLENCVGLWRMQERTRLSGL